MHIDNWMTMVLFSFDPPEKSVCVKSSGY